MRSSVACAIVAATACARAPAPPEPVTPRATAPLLVLGEIEPSVAWLVPSSDVTFDAARTPRVPQAVRTYSLPGCVDVTWTVRGPSAAPVRTRGPSVTVTFAAPGQYMVTARCAGEERTLAVSLCDFAAVLSDAAAYFGDSLEWPRITIDYDGTITGASWVAHDDVSIGDGVLAGTNGCPAADHYVHELGHVWEHQHGQLQLFGGAIDQMFNLIEDVYDFGGPQGVRDAVAAGRVLESFNREQQAEIFATDFVMKRAGATDDYARDLATLTAPALARRVRAAPPP